MGARKLLLAALAVVLSLRVLNIGYLADDFTLVAASRNESLLAPFPAGGGHYYRPLVMASLRLEQQFSTAPWVSHLGNVFIHFGTTVLVWFLARELARDRARTASFGAALVFFVHPIATSDIAWVSGRTDLLAGFFGVASLLAFARGAVVAPACLTLAALGAKEAALALPLMHLALLLLGMGRRPALVGVTTTTVVWAMLLRLHFGATSTFGVASALRTFIAAPLALVAAPSSLMSLAPIAASHSWLYGVAALLLVALAALLARIVGVSRASGARMLLVLAPLMPLVAGAIVPSSRQLYVPLAALCVVLPCLPELLALPLLALSFGEISLWRDASARTESYCAEYLDLGPADALLTSPSSVDGVPLWSNHVANALTSCAGRPTNVPVRTMVEITSARTTPSVTVRRTGPHRFEVAAEPGTRLRTEDGYAARVTIEEPSANVLFFDGIALRRAP